MSLKRFLWIIASGITGTLLSIGVFFILILLISGWGPALPYLGIGRTIEKWEQTWTIQGIYTASIAVGVIGFLLGVVASWRHLWMIQKCFAPTIAFSIPMILIGWLLHIYASHVEVPQNLKLADCSKETIIHLKVPKGRYYRLVIAPPSGATNIFSGYINISDETMFTNISIGPNLLEQPCDFFHAQSNYNIKITFDQSPPASTLLELHWLQTQRDRAE